MAAAGLNGVGEYMRATGKTIRTIVAGEEIGAFVPVPLPPRNPSMRMDDGLTELLRKATEGLSKLALSGDMVPSMEWFIYAFVRKEAVLSSQIEGTQATLVDLLRYEAESEAGATVSDVWEVCNYLDALSYGREELRRENGLPLSMRLLNELHLRLLQGARGLEKLPGNIRRSQNWIGGSRPGNARFVPPPPSELPELLSDFERYIHSADETPPLIRAGWLHVQFETIHPYLDGNGRIGRLLITLLLEYWRLLPRPLLYLSLFFKQHRNEYYERLAAVRTHGDWEGWTRFFLEAVSTVSEEATRSAIELFALVSRDRDRVLKSDELTITAVKLFEQLPKQPIFTAKKAMDVLLATRPTVDKAIQILSGIGILRETTGRKRDRTFAYGEYLDLLKVGTEL